MTTVRTIPTNKPHNNTLLYNRKQVGGNRKGQLKWWPFLQFCLRYPKFGMKIAYKDTDSNEKSMKFNFVC